MSYDFFKMKIKPLDATNYYVWSNEMDLVLRGMGTWKYVDLSTNNTADRESEIELKEVTFALA